MAELAFQQCIMPACGATFAIDEILTACPTCGGLIDVKYDWDRLTPPKSLSEFEAEWADRSNPRAFSGVWRFHRLLPFVKPEQCVTIGEGQTLLHPSDGVARFTGMQPGRLFLQYEGMNPSGSFKDNGMTGATTHAKLVGATRAACASTGNTSASLALYCSVTQLMKAIIFVGSGKISYGKLSQALDYGALTLQIEGDFDDAMDRVQEVTKRMGVYLVNSVNPFRLEGQKTIMFRVLEALRWETPDWIVVPGGNLGNSSAFGKAFSELYELGLIDKIPRLAIINASGADTLNRLYTEGVLTDPLVRNDSEPLLTSKGGVRWNGGSPDQVAIDQFFQDMDAEGRRASTIASAIEINRPVNLMKCLRALEICDGVVRKVSDQEILDAKARVGANGLGCEPASATSVAGTKKLVEEGVIGKDERVVCILTGHQLKDPTATVAYHAHDPELFEKTLASRGVERAEFANRAVQVPNDPDAIIREIQAAE